jgi:hypothetical protein
MANDVQDLEKIPPKSDLSQPVDFGQEFHFGRRNVVKSLEAPVLAERKKGASDFDTLNWPVSRRSILQQRVAAGTAQMRIRTLRGNATARRSGNESFLQQVGLVDVTDGVGFLSDRRS